MTTYETPSAGRSARMAWQRHAKLALGCEVCGQAWRHTIESAMGQALADNDAARVLQWDHLDDSTKLGNPSDIAYSGPFDKLITELLKCRVLCGNCHTIETYMRRE